MPNDTKSVDPKVSEYMKEIGRRGGLRRTKAKRESGRKNVRKALRVSQALAKQRKEPKT
jgi:hypothetical protein